MMHEGRFPAYAKDYGLSETKGGDLQVFVVLDVKFGEDAVADVSSMTWYGSLKSEKAQEITFKALNALGFKGPGLGALQDGVDSGAIDTSREVSVVVAQEPDQEGKLRWRVKWINAPGGGGPKRADTAKAKAALSKLDGAFKKFRTMNPAAPAAGDSWD